MMGFTGRFSTVLLLAVLAGCANRNVAPVVERGSASQPRVAVPAPAPAVAVPRVADSRAEIYVVKRGDTLINIALDQGLDYRELAQWNSLSDPNRIQVGQELRLRAPESVAQASPVRSAGDKVDWGWPVPGKLIAGFSEATNKGIDIAGKQGDPVFASAGGRVVYSGQGLRGYGKLIIIKHNNTFLSAYAHNKEILVKEGQTVVKGQKIAEVGNTDADQTKLHFEIRRLGKPVDPAKFLPARPA